MLVDGEIMSDAVGDHINILYKTILTTMMIMMILNLGDYTSTSPRITWYASLHLKYCVHLM